MSDEPPDTLLVNRCTEPRGLTSSGTIACGSCKQDCWIAPTSIAAIKRWPFIRVLCLHCAKELAEKNGPTIREIGMAPGGSKELTDALERELRKKKRR